MSKEIQNMGAGSERIFSGKAESKPVQELYNETQKLFSDEIRKRLLPNREYAIADIGSFKGELLKQVCDKLSEYRLKGVAVDINQNVLGDNIFEARIVGKAEQLPFEDESVDVEIMRYVLQWNYPENQKNILKEISRTIKEFALIEHVGAENEEPDEWRRRNDKLFDGSSVSRLKRGEHFFSSRNEIEQWMNEEGITFERIAERIIENGSEVYVERFDIDRAEMDKIKNILGDKDFFTKTTWIIFPKKRF